MPQLDSNTREGLPGILLAIALLTVLAAFVIVAVSIFTTGLAMTYTAVVLSAGALALLAAAQVVARRAERDGSTDAQGDVQRPAPL